ncbi:MAG: fibronectin type III domain-containing protein [Lachnospiraceae bacterium]
MMKKWMKKVGIALLCVSLAMGINICKTSAAMVDEAVWCEFGELYTGAVSGGGEGTVYYKFSLSERSRITLNLAVNDINHFHPSMYDGSGEMILKYDLIEYTYNSLTDEYEAHPCRTLEAGTYYLEVCAYEYSGRVTTYSFSVRNEEQIKLPKGQISFLKSKKKGQITVKCEPSTDALGYYIQYSTDMRFKVGVKSALSPTPLKTIKGLIPGQRYYVKACPYSVYDDGTIVYGQNSLVKKVKLKK